MTDDNEELRKVPDSSRLGQTAPGYIESPEASMRSERDHGIRCNTRRVDLLSLLLFFLVPLVFGMKVALVVLAVLVFQYLRGGTD